MFTHLLFELFVQVGELLKFVLFHFVFKGEECNMSSECDVTRGLCCQLQRRHRQASRKVSTFLIHYSFSKFKIV